MRVHASNVTYSTHVGLLYSRDEPCDPLSIFNEFSKSVNPVPACVCACVCVCLQMHAFTLAYVYAYESVLVIECAQVARVISVSDRMMLGEAVHINPIHICEA